MVTVKSGGLLVLCIDHKCKNGNFRAQDARRCICQQSPTETTPLVCGIHRKATDTRGGNRRITG